MYSDHPAPFVTKWRVTPFKKFLYLFFLLVIVLRVGIEHQNRRQFEQFCVDNIGSIHSVRIRGKTAVAPKLGVVLQNGRIEDRVPIPVPIRIQTPELGVSWMIGRQVEYVGSVHCDFPHRNFSFLEDVPFRNSIPKLKLEESSGKWSHFGENSMFQSYRARWYQWLLTPVAGNASLRSLIKAVWMGDFSELPSELKDFYLRAGLSHVLALSGQHLVIFAFGLKVFFFTLLFFYRFTGGSIAQLTLLCLRGGPLLAAAILCFSSPGNLPVYRAAIMVILREVLRWRRFSVSPFQFSCSSFALSLLIDPSWIHDLAFALSCFATAWLYFVMTEGKGSGLKGYFKIQVTMVLVLLPITAFYFGRISLASPLFGLLIGAFWDFFWIPVGFLLPLILRVAPVESCLTFLWDWFVVCHQSATTWHLGFFAVPRPAWWELVLLLWVMIAVMRCAERVQTAQILEKIE